MDVCVPSSASNQVFAQTVENIRPDEVLEALRALPRTEAMTWSTLTHVRS